MRGSSPLVSVTGATLPARSAGVSLCWSRSIDYRRVERDVCPVSDERRCGKITFNSKVHFKACLLFLPCRMNDLGLSVGQRLGDGWMGVGEVGKSLVEGLVQFQGE